MIAEIQTGELNGNPVRSLPIEVLPTSSNGWPLRPFQIVSLWEMLIRFDAYLLVKCIHAQGRLVIRIAALSHAQGNGALIDDHPEIIVRLREQLDELLPLVSLCGLKGSVDRIEQMGVISAGSKSGMTLPVV